MSVLITGGTGTLGRAYIRRALLNGEKRICIYSRDEHKQAVMREEFGNDDRLRWFVGDVRDKVRLTRALEDIELIINAAALKRVEVGEYNSDELVKTNVMGTINVIEAAHAARVSNVIAISTDKASSPFNAYGASKLLMEKLIIGANNASGRYGPCFSVVRLANLANSRGSVIPTWQTILSRGDTVVPVTDPDCTRFVMTEKQTIDAIVELQRTMRGGEIVIPHDLKAFKLSDLMVAMNVTGEPSGLRPGERLHEEMSPGVSSEHALRLSIDELRELLK